MSSLSGSSYGKILGYWLEKLSQNPYKIKFLFTKLIEIAAFKKYSSNPKENFYHIDEFPRLLTRCIAKKPFVSIVIPAYIKTRQDVSAIELLLQSIAMQTVRPNNTIIIDDCSPILYTFPKQIQTERQRKNAGPAAARNIGKRIALENDADIIAFTDADCILSENWISTIIDVFQSINNFSILSGNTISYDKNWFGMYHNFNGTLNGRRFKGHDRLLYGTTANLAVTRQVALDIDFNEKFLSAAGEDIEFCFQANKLGFAIKHIPEMIVFHNYRYTTNFLQNLKLFWRQFIKYGQGDAILLEIIPNYYAYFDKTEEITGIGK
jgi:GT2 family glycosyltransferase